MPRDRGEHVQQLEEEDAVVLVVLAQDRVALGRRELRKAAVEVLARDPPPLRVHREGAPSQEAPTAQLRGRAGKRRRDRSRRAEHGAARRERGSCADSVRLFYDGMVPGIQSSTTSYPTIRLGTDRRQRSSTNVSEVVHGLASRTPRAGSPSRSSRSRRVGPGRDISRRGTGDSIRRLGSCPPAAAGPPAPIAFVLTRCARDGQVARARLVPPAAVRVELASADGGQVFLQAPMARVPDASRRADFAQFDRLQRRGAFLRAGRRSSRPSRSAGRQDATDAGERRAAERARALAASRLLETLPQPEGQRRQEEYDEARAGPPNRPAARTPATARSATAPTAPSRASAFRAGFERELHEGRRRSPNARQEARRAVDGPRPERRQVEPRRRRAGRRPRARRRFSPLGATARGAGPRRRRRGSGPPVNASKERSLRWRRSRPDVRTAAWRGRSVQAARTEAAPPVTPGPMNDW